MRVRRLGTVQVTTYGMFRDEKTHDYTVCYPATESEDAVDTVIEANITGVQDALRKEAIEAWGKWEVAKAAVRSLSIVNGMVATFPVVGDPTSSHPAVKFLAGVPGYKKDEAAKLGTGVHAVGEALNRGDAPSVSDTVRPLAERYYRGFIESYRPQFHPDYIEFMVASVKYEYAGTMDMVCRIGGEVFLLDIKTSSKKIDLSPKGFPYPDTALQLAAGRWADFMGKPNDPKRYPIPPITRCGVVAVTPDDCQLIEYDVTPEDFRTFLAARKAWGWTQHRKEEVKRGPVAVPPVEVKAA